MLRMTSVPLARLRHGSGHGLAHQERAFDVDAQHGIEIFFSDVKKIGRAENAGVVDQHIDAALPVKRLPHQLVHLRLVAHVAVHIQTRKLGRQCRAARIVHIREHDMCALGGKAPNAGRAYALCGACNEADTASVAEGNGVVFGGYGRHGRMVASRNRGQVGFQ